MVGRTFLFRDGSKKTADETDRWLTMLAEDAKLVSCAMGERSFARVAERLETVRYERLRKGRGKYREAVIELVSAVGKQTEKLLGRQGSCLYPTIRSQMIRRARVAQRVVRSGGAECEQCAEKIRLLPSYLTSVRETAEVAERYLDPSCGMNCTRLTRIVDRLEGWEKAARIQGAGDCSDKALTMMAQEVRQTIGEYRHLLAEMDKAASEGTLLAVFPQGFLIWADSVCAFSERALLRIVRGKEVFDAEDESEEMVVRTCACLPMTILAEETGVSDSVEEVVQTDVQPVECDKNESELSAEESVSAETLVASDEADKAEDNGSIERIYAKASDYKAVVAKVIRKKEQHGVIKPRTLGRHS